MLVVACVTVPVVIVWVARFGTLRKRLIVAGVWVFLVVPAVGVVWYHLAPMERRSPTHLSTRVAAWRACVEMEKRAPLPSVLTGHGAFRRVFPAAVEHYGIAPVTELSGRRLPHPHNAFLRALVEAGVMGALALVVVLVAAFFSASGAALRGRGRAEGAVAAALCVALIGVVVMAGMNANLSGNVPGQLGWLVVGMAFFWGRAGRSVPA